MPALERWDVGNYPVHQPVGAPASAASTIIASPSSPTIYVRRGRKGKTTAAATSQAMKMPDSVRLKAPIIVMTWLISPR